MHAQNRGWREEKRLEANGLGAGEGSQGLQNIRQMRPAARTRQDEVDRLKAEAEALKDQARLEDLNVWEMEKHTKKDSKGSKTYTNWMASWREGDAVRNVHLGSSRKLDAEAARQKAQKMKAEALGI